MTLGRNIDRIERNIESIESKFAKIFKQPKNREDGSDFDDFWTESIVSTQSIFSKIFERTKTLDFSISIRLELPGPLGGLAVRVEFKCFVSAPFSIENGAETIENGAETIESSAEMIENGAEKKASRTQSFCSPNGVTTNQNEYHGDCK